MFSPCDRYLRLKVHVETWVVPGSERVNTVVISLHVGRGLTNSPRTNASNKLVSMGGGSKEEAKDRLFG
jgi:hypothetical protein